jgi:hypothetical protein
MEIPHTTRTPETGNRIVKRDAVRTANLLFCDGADERT